jgi:hypothetical protein
MAKMLEKLNHKGNKRIAVINASKNILSDLHSEEPGLTIDKEIDPRFPYDFMMIFVKSKAEVDNYSQMALHNLMCDGVLWFCYPKKTSRNYNSDIDRDHGWKALNDADFHGIRLVAIDNDWSALRFRNSKFIKSTSEKFKK